MTPLVSILMPAFNAERWIAEALSSAVAQTWPRVEVIVVDDGSRDRTAEVARTFAGRSVQVVTQPNQGAAAARNMALTLAQGDYIQWLDADDLLSPDKIRRQMDAIARDGSPANVLLSCGWAYFMADPSRAQFSPTPLWCDLSPAEWMIRKLGDNLHMQTATWLVSRPMIDATGPWDTRLVVDDDGEYFARALRLSGGVKFVTENGVFYRRRASGRVSIIGRSEPKMAAQLTATRLQIEYLRALDDSPRARTACLRHLQTFARAWYPERPDIFREAGLLARDLGGTLDTPTFSWKYSWLQTLFGVSAAKRAQTRLPLLKLAILSALEGLVYRLRGQLGRWRGTVRSGVKVP
jgi:glycosyltransferase involved in cell wall biosynthesis